MQGINSINQCISEEEKKKRTGVLLINAFGWFIFAIFVVVSYGLVLGVYAVIWVINFLLSEYNVRKLLSVGTAASPKQFPEIYNATVEICEQLGIKRVPRVIILNESSINAFAVKFAREKVIVLLSQTLEGVIDKPQELRFFLGHELAHVVLDHGWRGSFEMYKPASYKAAREMTCDNVGAAVAGDLNSAVNALKRTAIGNHLIDRIDDEHLEDEASYIYSGFTGWLLKQYMSYPPLGKRINGVKQFVQEPNF
ncbi:MAG: hypothetical protein A2X49_08550 [Lentisphaerae bacterium GWF2_52_8]|nr:MAG: hypothetical protein A2X49_08550 [Lentisphaerae bacterium GWF2_52_8]